MTSTTPTPRREGYEQFFGFSDRPFSLSADPRFRFPSAAHEDALSQVLYALERREPVVVVTGDIGLGKTLLCRTVLERIPRKTFLSVIQDPLLGPDDLLKRILEDFGVISAAGAGSIRASRHDLTHAMNTFVASLGPLDAHAVVIVDEAQHVQPDVLEQLRLLANIGDDRGTLLQIVLVGQPDLEALLAQPDLQQLRQRVTRWVSLSALTDDEVKRYIAHRLAVAREPETDSPIPGARDLARAVADWNESSRPVTFTDDAIAAAARISHGIPRLLNVLCDRTLEVAFAERSRTVDAAMVEAAARLVQLQDEPPSETAEIAASPRASRTGRLLAIAAAIVIVGMIGWLGIRARQRVPRGQPAAVDTRPKPAPAPPAVVTTPAPAPPAATPPSTPASTPAATPAAAQPDTASPTPVASPNPPAAGSDDASETLEIVVASFHTESKATEVLGQLKALGQPAQQRSIGGWQQVVTGPFPSRTAAEEAQRQLDRAGFTGTSIVRSAR